MSGTSHGPPGELDLVDVAAKNPRVDLDQVKSAQRAVESLREQGVAPAGYEITSPYQRPSRGPNAMPRAGRRFA